MSEGVGEMHGVMLTAYKAVSMTGDPMSATPDLQELEKHRDDLRQQLASVGDLRPGSLVAVPKVRETLLPLRERWIAWARAELVSDPSRCRQDGDAHHSAGRRGADSGADRRVSTLAPTYRGVDRGQRSAVSDAAVGRARGRRRGGGEKKGFKEGFAAEVDAEIEALVGPGAADA